MLRHAYALLAVPARRGRPAQQALQVPRTAGFGSGARQALSAERLHAHHGADHVAIDIDVADARALDDFIDRGLDARSNPERQAVAGGVDCIQQRTQAAPIEAQYVQHRAEYLCLELAYRCDFDQARGHEYPALALRGERALAAQLRAHRPQVGIDAGARRLIDQRTHVGGNVGRVAHAQLLHRPFQHGQYRLGDLTLQAQQPQRRAALPGGIEGRAQHVGDHLLGQRGGIHDHRVLAAGLGDQRYRPAQRQRACDRARRGGRAGEHHAANARIRDQPRTHALTVTRQQLQHRARHTGLVQQLHRARRGGTALLGRFGEHGVAGRQRRRHLAGEDRQRKVPWTDAHHRAQWQMRRLGELRAHLRGVVAQEIHRFPDLAHRIGECLARLAHRQRHQCRQLLLVELRRALENLRPLIDFGLGPARRTVDRGADGRIDHVVGGIEHAAQQLVQIGRVVNLAPQVVARRTGHARAGRRAGHQRLHLDHWLAAVLDRRHQRGAHRRIGQIEPQGIAPFGSEQIRRQRDQRMRRAGIACRRNRGVGAQALQRCRRRRRAVHERGCCSVLDQAPHQVGEQRRARTNRRIDAHRAGDGRCLQQLSVQSGPHAKQALELIVAGAFRRCQLADGRDAVRVVGRKLRHYQRVRRQQAARTGQVGNVGVGLAGIHRIAGQAVHLRPLDFRVPVRALDQTHQQAGVTPRRQLQQVVDHRRRAFLIRLHRDSQAGPVGQLRRAHQRLDQIERRRQPIGFLGIDHQRDVVVLRQARQLQQARQQFAHDALLLRVAIAWMQRR